MALCALATPVAANEENDRRAAGEVSRAHGDIHAHGLLYVDVFPGVHGVDRHRRMPVVRSADDYRVYALVSEKVFVVVIALGLCFRDAGVEAATVEAKVSG